MLPDRERLKLLFGPYRAPPLRRGDKAFCLFRDADVVVTSWTDARIPWPRCRLAEGTGGGSGLLVDEELARAVRHESAAAIKHWWGASQTAVYNWRRALGVTRTNNEGSHRLIQASAEAGGAVIHYRDISDKECDAWSRRAKELNLGRFLKTGYHGPLWTEEQLALLGKEPDDVVAAKIGRTENGVRVMRTRLGMPNPRDRRKWRRQ
jgi:hypothetical protein